MLNKANVYKANEVKGKLVVEEETIGYRDLVYMSRCCNFLCVD